MMSLLAFNLPVQTIQHFVESGGYYVLFGLLFACGLGLPMPEDIPLVLGGYFAATGHLDLLGVAIACWLGIIGGDCMLYYFGHRFGHNITRVPFIGKHVTKERIERAEHLFEQWGTWVVAVGRLFAGIRGAVVIAAGVIRFNFVRFIIVDSLAAIVSGALFVGIGYWAGRKLGDLNELHHKIQSFEHWLFGGLGLVVVGFFAYRWWCQRQEKPTLTDKALEKAATIKHESATPPASLSNETHPAEPKGAPTSAPARQH